MDEKNYEKMLSKHYQGTGDAEARWDAKAKHFDLSLKKDNAGYADKVVAFLTSRGILPDANVLDIGGGSGQYALPFAAHAAHVTVTDISNEMLALAKNEAKRGGLQNLSFVKSDWAHADIKEMNWEKAFDLVFAAMCPAVRSPIGFHNMSATSKGHCLMNQFITDTDSLASHLMKTLDIKRTFDPHNDRDTVQAAFNLLWLEGYEPEINYLRHEEKVTYTTETALERYAGRYGDMATAKGYDLKELIADYATGGSVTVHRNTTLAMLLWQV